MPRKQLIRTNQYPYHINARSNNQDWFLPTLDICFSIFLEVIKKTKEKYNFEFHHFVLMSNHFHMIVSTPDENLDKGMRYFMTETSKKIARASNRVNKIYGQRYHWTLIIDSIQYAHAVKYLYRNPLEANITKRCELYKYSSLRLPQLFTENGAGFDEHLPLEKFEFLKWINEPYTRLTQETIDQALKKSVFKVTRSRKTNQKVDLHRYLKNS